MEAAASRLHRQIYAMGAGMIRAIDHGLLAEGIADAAYRYQLMDDRGESGGGASTVCVMSRRQAHTTCASGRGMSKVDR